MQWLSRFQWKIIFVLLLALTGVGLNGFAMMTTAQDGGWIIGQIVRLPKHKLIRVGPGFSFKAHTCVPEDNWLVKVKGGPRFEDNETWYDIDRKALDLLDPSGTGWVVFDPSKDIFDPIKNPNVNCKGTPAGTPVPGADILPPVISDIQVWHDGEGNVVISALVTDNVKVAAVTLVTSVGSLAMTLGDDGRYYAILSKLKSGTKLDFSIWAVDTSGNETLAGPQQVKINFTGQAGLLPWTTMAGEPISLPLGNFVTRHTDLQVVGVGLPFDFTRTYNAHAPFDSALGFGWTHTYNFYLKEINNQLFKGVVLTYPDGHSAKYLKVGDSYITPAGHYDHLEIRCTPLSRQKKGQIISGLFSFHEIALSGCEVAECLMHAPVVVEIEVAGQTGARLAGRGVIV
jgi:hypothetical protein